MFLFFFILITFTDTFSRPAFAWNFACAETNNIFLFVLLLLFFLVYPMGISLALVFFFVTIVICLILCRSSLGRECGPKFLPSLNEICVGEMRRKRERVRGAGSRDIVSLITFSLAHWNAACGAMVLPVIRLLSVVLANGQPGYGPHACHEDSLRRESSFPPFDIFHESDNHCEMQHSWLIKMDSGVCVLCDTTGVYKRRL